MIPEDIIGRLRAREVKKETRRHFFEEVFGSSGFGIGAAALAGLLGNEREAGAKSLPQIPGNRRLDFAPRAKSVIYLQQAGGAPHIDLWDYKPTLARRDGQPAPDSLIRGDRFAFIRGVPNLAKSPFPFQQHGNYGKYLCSLLPNLATVVDEIAWVQSMHTTQLNHGPAQIFQMTGHPTPDRPSLGAWLSYGIGSEAKSLPGYVVLLSGLSNPDCGTASWGSGGLPMVHQGVPLESGSDDEISTRVSQYERAYQMQTSAPGLMDVMSEPVSIREMYGCTPGQRSYANNALLARRLVERGVRFVQLSHRYWDMHGVTYNEDIVNKTTAACAQTDRPTAALIKDLKQRGMLDSTLVIWASEFGRTPMRQAAPYFGRDHHPKGYTVWMAGGGIKPGLLYGATDEFGYHAVDKPTTPHDINATALHLLGIDQTELSHRFADRKLRLTGVEGNVIQELLA